MKHTNRRSLIGVLVILAAIVVLNVLEGFFPFRIDLTEEKRYSIHPATKQLLSTLEEPIEVEILLTGNLPGGMRRLQKSIEETLHTFDVYSAYPIRYYYSDPLLLDEEVREDYLLDLADYKINPTNLFASQNGGQTSRMIFPGIVLRSHQYETGALLLKG